jgi:hypothetical protein
MLQIILSSMAFALPPTLETETEDTLGNVPNTTFEAPIINGLDAAADEYPSTGGMLLHGVLLIFHWTPLFVPAH